MISGNRRRIYKLFALLKCYAAYIRSYLPTFRDSLSVPASSVTQSSRTEKQPHFIARLLRIRPTGCPERCVTFQKSEDLRLRILLTSFSQHNKKSFRWLTNEVTNFLTVLLGIFFLRRQPYRPALRH